MGPGENRDPQDPNSISRIPMSYPQDTAFIKHLIPQWIPFLASYGLNRFCFVRITILLLKNFIILLHKEFTILLHVHTYFKISRAQEAARSCLLKCILLFSVLPYMLLHCLCALLFGLNEITEPFGNPLSPKPHESMQPPWPLTVTVQNNYRSPWISNTMFLVVHESCKKSSCNRALPPFTVWFWGAESL